MVLGKQNLTDEAPGLQRPWWNRPLIGKRGMVQRILDWITRQPIPEETLKLHQRDYLQIQSIAHRIRLIDNEKFGNKEFLVFVKIQNALKRGEWGYPGFLQNIELLKVGVKAREAFVGLEKVEFGFQGSRLGEMYDFVASLCTQKVRSEVFQRQVKGKFSEILNNLKTEEGKQALQLYIKYLIDVSEHEMSLKLLYSFRQYNMQDYAIFKTISDVINSLGKEDLGKLDILKYKVIASFEIFENLAKVINIPESQKTPNTYAKILQYEALSEKYKSAFDQFQQMVTLFENWHNLDEQISIIRKEYPANKYKIPKDFKSEIPGSNLYEKYSKYFD